MEGNASPWRQEGMDGDEETRDGKQGMYEVLHLAKGADVEQVKRAYRNLANKCHPDKHQRQEDRDAAQETFRRIKEAYEVLADEQAREVHDKHGPDAALEMLKCKAQGKTYRGNERYTEGREEDEDEDAGELGAYTDPEELFRRFAKWRREQYEAELDATTNYRGAYVFGFNAANALRPYDTNVSRMPELTSAAISASATVPVTRKDYLNLGGNVVTRRGVGGGSVNLGWRHAFEDEAGSSVEGSATLGARTLFTAATSRRISEHCEASFAAAYEPGDGITLSVSSQQELGEHTQGEFGWTLGPAGGLQLLLSHQRGKWDLRGDLKLGLNGVGMSLVALKRLSKRLYARLAARFGTSGADMEAGFGGRISERSSAALSFVAGLQGTLAKIKISRAGGHKLLLPVALSPVLDVEAALALVAVAGLSTVGVILASHAQDSFNKKKIQEKLEVRHRRYEQDCRVVRQSAQRSRGMESRRGGLVILGAVYGDLSKVGRQDLLERMETRTRAVLEDPERGMVVELLPCPAGQLWIDVTDAVQFLVENGRLAIEGGVNKSGMVGFYDVALGKKKSLSIRYLFRDQLHDCMVMGDEALSAPMAHHRKRSG
uniref:J domain-containing protein n=1 Tax=Picocystis salinarum TaxID=88271 RepID=A0A7S3UB51_9CHLO